MELSRVRSVISAALSESDQTVSDATCGVLDIFPAEASRGLPGTSDGSSSGQL